MRQSLASLIGGALFQSFVVPACRIACFGAAVLAGGTFASGAHAAGSCSGTMAASLLHPLPVPVSVALQTSVANSANPALTQRFVDGLRNAGVTVTGTGNMMLSMAVSVVPSASGASGGIGGTYRGFDWVTGEQAPTPGQASIRDASVSLSVTLTDNAQYTQSWIATVGCVVHTDDSGALAQDLGEVIGRNLGQNFDSKPI